MHALILSALLSAQHTDDVVVRVKFDTITLKDAELLAGKTVVTTFVVKKPAFTWGEGKNLRTVTAPADGSQFERTVILKGNRLHDADLGAKLTVVGTLRVIQHPSATIGGIQFGGFTEVRIEE